MTGREHSPATTQRVLQVTSHVTLGVLAATAAMDVCYTLLQLQWYSLISSQCTTQRAASTVSPIPSIAHCTLTAQHQFNASWMQHQHLLPRPPGLTHPLPSLTSLPTTGSSGLARPHWVRI
ncbi:hypothetical protein V2G26_019704 [Clonostachys chloroleuca]